VDTTRITPSTRRSQQLPTRTLPTEIRKPNVPGPFPLVVFAHGFGDKPRTYDKLLDALAQSGYIVVAPTFPGHSMGAMTVIDLVGNEATIDPRITAAVVLAGRISPRSNSGYFDGTRPVPMLFIHGDLDREVPIISGRFAFATARQPKWFVTVNLGDHLFGRARRPELLHEPAPSIWKQ
jgi:fermentation-respiration switch protein FrsA (DUF1100 family)